MRESATIFLTQTDTTAGLLCTNPTKLNLIKSRPQNQPIILESASLQILKSLVRVPKAHRNRVRRAKKSSFIYGRNIAIRLVFDEIHLRFLKHFGALYSTSANQSQKRFNQKWAINKSDIVIYDERELCECVASKMYKINRIRIQRRR